MVSRVKGTRDFLDLVLFNFLSDEFRQHMAVYNFDEIATPIIEPLELFQRSLGDYTDVVGKEMFLVQGMGSSDKLCLRPEATAPVTRAFLENGIQTTPWNVFSIGPMFRHERPQKGRYRQFHQLNVEVVGTESAARDVELIVLLDRLFHDRLLLNNYGLTINFLGCADDRNKYKALLVQFLNSETGRGVCDTCQQRRDQNTLRVFDCKNPKCQEILTQAPSILDHLCGDCQGEWGGIQERLELLSVSFTVKPSLVRGLDYYNKGVFEFVSDVLGAQSAFCAGGRYELAQQLGARKPVPSLGAAIGIERLMMLFEASERRPLPEKKALYAIMPLSEEQQVLALLVADTLRAEGLAVDALVDGSSLKSMMRTANRIGAAYALMIGEDEQKAREVMVRSMVTGEQERVAQIDLVAYLSK